MVKLQDFFFVATQWLSSMAGEAALDFFFLGCSDETLTGRGGLGEQAPMTMLQQQRAHESPAARHVGDELSSFLFKKPSQAGL